MRFVLQMGSLISCVSTTILSMVFCHASHASEYNQSPAYIVAGSVTSLGPIYEPLMLTGDNEGNFSYHAVLFSAPVEYKESFLRNVSCSDDLCVASGAYKINRYDFNAHPVLLVSHDHGKQWRQLEHITNLPTENGGISHVSCYQSKCIAAGDGIAISRDHATSWSWQASPVSSIDKLNVKALSCTSSSCLITGYATSAEQKKQFVMLLSHDYGLSWEDVSFDFSLPEDATNLQVDKLVCNENKCVAAGGYTRKTNHSAYPLLFVSSDGGSSWSKVTEIQNFRKKLKSKALEINDVTIEHDTIVAVGHYKDLKQQNDVNHPLLFSSQDGGQTWSFFKRPIDKDWGYNSLDNVSCSHSTCVAAGHNAFFSSQDDGKTWTQIRERVDAVAMPGYSRVMCSPTQCIALGRHGAGEGMVLENVISRDQGNTWAPLPPIANLPRKMFFDLLYTSLVK